MKKIYLIILASIVVLPIGIGVVVSWCAWSALSTSNDWIGFWGGYAGSIIGGIITLVVMKTTIAQNQNMQHQIAKQDLCNRVANLVSAFCREMLSYRGKWRVLKEESGDGPIDQMKRLEFEATSESAREPFFELQILLASKSDSADLLKVMENILNDSNFTALTVKDADKKLSDLRVAASVFIQKMSGSNIGGG